MAKMTRNALKGIVKECLVEILSEGLDTPGSSSTLSESKKVAHARRRKAAIQAEEARLAAHRQKFETRVTDTVSQVTDDPIMQGILADTARSTLQEQANHDISPMQGTGDMSTQSSGMPSAGINLEGIFGSSKQNWADLAFTKSESD